MSDDKEPGHIRAEHEGLYIEGLWKNSDELWKKRNEYHMQLLEKSVQRKHSPLMLEHQPQQQRN